MESATNGASRKRRSPVYWLACALMFTLLTGMEGCPPGEAWDSGSERDGGGNGSGGGGGSY